MHFRLHRTYCREYSVMWHHELRHVCHGCHTLTRYGTALRTTECQSTTTLRHPWNCFSPRNKGASQPDVFYLDGLGHPPPPCRCIIMSNQPSLPSFELIRSTNKTVSTPSKFPETLLFLRWTLIKISKSLRARVANFLITSSKLSFHSLPPVVLSLNYKLKHNISVKLFFLCIFPFPSTCCKII